MKFAFWIKGANCPAAPQHPYIVEEKRLCSLDALNAPGALPQIQETAVHDLRLNTNSRENLLYKLTALAKFQKSSTGKIRMMMITIQLTLHSRS